MIVGGDEETLELLQLLSNNIGISILKSLQNGKWCIASNVSKSLGIHTTTAQKYLSRMYEIGLLQRRVRPCKTRNTYEYLLKSPKIQIELDLTRIFEDNRPLPRSVYRFYFSMFFSLVAGARKIAGSQFDAIVEDNIKKLKAESDGEVLLFLRCLEHCKDSEQALEYFWRESSKDKTGESIKDTLFSLLRGILGSYEAQMGKTAAKQIVEVSLNGLLKDNSALIEKYGLWGDLPQEYFSSIGGK